MGILQCLQKGVSIIPRTGAVQPACTFSAAAPPLRITDPNIRIIQFTKGLLNQRSQGLHRKISGGRVYFSKNPFGDDENENIPLLVYAIESARGTLATKMLSTALR